MKREILFRAWDKVEGKYFEPIYEAYKGNLLDLSISLNGRFLRRTIEIPAEDESCFQDRYILEQFTGLTDKNGVKIFEGDVFKYAEHSGYLLRSFTAVVSYKDYVASFAYLKCGLDENGWEQPLIHFFNESDEFEEDILPHIEVIGNIHDNSSDLS